MPEKTKTKAARLQPRIRILCGKEIAFGPGKADLLEHIQETGSISLAAKTMGISYMRAWTLIQTMNACFKEPLVTSSRGGKEKGGAELTSAGHQVLAHYRQLESNAVQAAEAGWLQLRKMLRE